MPQASLRIVSHNCFWFQGAPFETDSPPDPNPHVLAALVDLYRSLGADVICMQEVQHEAAAAAVARQLGPDYQVLYQPGGQFPQYGGAIFARRPFRAWPNAGAGKVARVRIGITITARPGVEVGLANLHLPSSRQLGPGGAAVCRRLEIEQALAAGRADVADQSEPTGPVARPLIVLGDFNERPDGACAELLLQCGLQLVGPPVSGEVPTTIRGGLNDQVWISASVPATAYDFCAVERERLATTIPEKQYLSDHLPVGITLRL